MHLQRRERAHGETLLSRGDLPDWHSFGQPPGHDRGNRNLKLPKRDGFYRELGEKSASLSSGIAEAAKKAAFPFYYTRVGRMFCAFLPAVKREPGLPPPAATPVPLPVISWRGQLLRMQKEIFNHGHCLLPVF